MARRTKESVANELFDLYQFWQPDQWPESKRKAFVDKRLYGKHPATLMSLDYEIAEVNSRILEKNREVEAANLMEKYPNFKKYIEDKREELYNMHRDEVNRYSDEATECVRAALAKANIDSSDVWVNAGDTAVVLSILDANGQEIFGSNIEFRRSGWWNTPNPTMLFNYSTMSFDPTKESNAGLVKRLLVMGTLVSDKEFLRDIMSIINKSTEIKAEIRGELEHLRQMEQDPAEYKPETF